jgi:hypothetical protein
MTEDVLLVSLLVLVWCLCKANLPVLGRPENLSKLTCPESEAHLVSYNLPSLK